MFTELLTQTVDLTRPSVTTDALGDEVSTYAAVANGTAVRCRKQPLNTKYKVEERLKAGRPLYTLYVEGVSGLIVKISDKATLSDGTVLRVLEAEKDSSGHHWQLLTENWVVTN
jgi:hypothetical protein